MDRSVKARVCGRYGGFLPNLYDPGHFKNPVKRQSIRIAHDGGRCIDSEIANGARDP